MQNIKLYKHQENIIYANPSRYLLAHACGTGKTLTGISLANKNCQSVLVICPKSIKETWIRKMTENSTVPDWIVLSKEEFRRDWNKLKRYDGEIIDEAHYFSGINSMMTKALIKYNKKWNIKYRWLMTATPYMSTPWNIFTIATHLGYYISCASFRAQFFYDINMGGRRVPVIKTGIEDDLKKIVNKIGNTVPLNECVDMPEQVFEVEYFKPTKEQEKAISDITDLEHIVKWTKTHQILGGYLTGNEYEVGRQFECDKLSRIIELATDNDRIIITARYLGEIAMIKEALKDIEKDVYVLNGATKDRQDLFDKLKSKKKYVLLVSASVSEGWELPECPLMVFYSHDFALKNYIQLQGRISRISNPKRNVYISLVVEDSIDEDVYKCLDKKEDFHLSLYRK